MLNVISYIVPNVVIALILVCGVIQGTRRGWAKTLIKLGYTLALAVGTFFLGTMVVAPALVKVEALQSLAVLLPTIAWFVLFIATMLIAQCIETIVNHCIRKKRKAERSVAVRVNGAKHNRKTEKVELTDAQKAELKARKKEEKKSERKLERQHRKDERRVWKSTHKKSRVFGGIIGFVGGLVISLFVMTMVSHVGLGITLSGQPDVGKNITAFYDHSIVGIIDNGITKDKNCAEGIFNYEIEQFAKSLEKDASANK